MGRQLEHGGGGLDHHAVESRLQLTPHCLGCLPLVYWRTPRPRNAQVEARLRRQMPHICPRKDRWTRTLIAASESLMEKWRAERPSVAATLERRQPRYVLAPLGGARG
jgi:hypothetical protein